jgi:hypothetical protein
MPSPKLVVRGPLPFFAGSGPIAQKMTFLAGSCLVVAVALTQVVPVKNIDAVSP